MSAGTCMGVRAEACSRRGPRSEAQRRLMRHVYVQVSLSTVYSVKGR